MKTPDETDTMDIERTFLITGVRFVCMQKKKKQKDLDLE